MTRHTTTSGREVSFRGDSPATVDRALARAAAVGTTAALLGTSAVYAAARAAGLVLVVTPPGGSAGEVPFASVVGAVLVSGVVALAAAVVLRRRTNGRRWFTVLATLALVGSFASPIGAAEKASTAAVLSLMHVVVGLCLIPLLARRMGATR
jgi:hypothetical protein